MESVTIIRPVTIKVKVTELFKKRLVSELHESLKKIEADLKHLEFQKKRMISELEKQNPQGIPAARKHLEQQTNRRLEARQKIHEKIREVADMALGSEVVYGTVDSIVEVKIGHDWKDIMGVEILVNDDKIVDIRHMAQLMG